MTSRCSISVPNFPLGQVLLCGWTFLPALQCWKKTTYTMRDDMDIRLNLIKKALWGKKKIPLGDTWCDTVSEPWLQRHDPHNSNQQSKTFSAATTKCNLKNLHKHTKMFGFWLVSMHRVHPCSSPRLHVTNWWIKRSWHKTSQTSTQRTSKQHTLKVCLLRIGPRSKPHAQKVRLDPI